MQQLNLQVKRKLSLYNDGLELMKVKTRWFELEE